MNHVVLDSTVQALHIADVQDLRVEVQFLRLPVDLKPSHVDLVVNVLDQHSTLAHSKLLCWLWGCILIYQINLSREILTLDELKSNAWLNTHLTLIILSPSEELSCFGLDYSELIS